MTISPATLTRTAGFSAALAGALYVFIQFIHPHEDLAAVESAGWIVTAALTGLMALLALVGITGMYVRNVREMGLLGLIAYLLYGAFFFVVISFSFLEALVLPQLAGEAPSYVAGVLALFSGEGASADLGALEAVNPFAGVTYLVGGLLFGIALVRARVLARWAAVLLASGSVVALAVQFLPHSVGRMAALPVGIALIGLGSSLVRGQRASGSVPAIALAGAR